MKFDIRTSPVIRYLNLLPCYLHFRGELSILVCFREGSIPSFTAKIFQFVGMWFEPVNLAMFICKQRIYPQWIFQKRATIQTIQPHQQDIYIYIYLESNPYYIQVKISWVKSIFWSKHTITFLNDHILTQKPCYQRPPATHLHSFLIPLTMSTGNVLASQKISVRSSEPVKISVESGEKAAQETWFGHGYGEFLQKAQVGRLCVEIVASKKSVIVDEPS